jgi:hypothetical protein
MPVQYARDDAKRRITLTVSDPLTLEERIGAVEHQLADGAWRYALIIDARRSLASATPQLTEMQAAASRLAELVAAHGPRGPVALVSRQPGVIGASAMHNSLGVKTPGVQVFWDLDDAQTFLDRLDAETASSRPPEPLG